MFASAYPEDFKLTPDEEAKGAFKGTVGKREEFVLKCTKVIPLTEGWHVKIYLFEGLDRNAFAWFASKDSVYEEGQIYRIRATVKRHSVYRGVRQTTIFRLKVVGDYIPPVQSKDFAEGESVVDLWNSL
jgi:hypothetical protein